MLAMAAAAALVLWWVTAHPTAAPFVPAVATRVRDLDGVLSKKVVEKIDGALAKSGRTAQGLYQELSVSDQAQMREFYLSKLEAVDIALRHRFKKLFQYY